MVRRRKESKVGVDDLVLLDQLSEDKIVENLRIRYAKDNIYTSIGPVLIAVNPFKNIPQLYTEATIRSYKGKSQYELAPHVYSLADDTYRNMVNFSENQCVIITGESGSGKTETSKIIMQYISAVSGKSAEVQRVKERMLASNPVLEAFGNAKTVNNNNSSRFGKYMLIMFDFRGDPAGGVVTNYLLEKSRVVTPAQGERNFHIFYQLCLGMSPEEREQYWIYAPEQYYYLFSSGCYNVDTINDERDYKEMRQGLLNIGFTEDDISETFKLISAILWLGNVTFEEDHTERASVADRQVLDVVAALLNVDAALLESALCTRTIVTGSGARAEIYQKPNTRLVAENTRDTLAKALYSRMFDWIVSKVNESITVPEEDQNTHIGVLDIYGFEIFQFNTFEQLCINYVNERLQQIFIQLTLKAEQEEYRNEGIQWTDVAYFDNKPCCELIQNKPGILSVCDDACNTSKTDQMFANDLMSAFGSNSFLKCGSNNFTITHYAGNVRYDVDGFLERNKDTLFDDLVLLVQRCQTSFVAAHGWTDIHVQQGQKKRPPTVGKTFKNQVNSLVGALSSCVPHYIRCIKPNNTKRANDFDVKYTKNQVKYLGLLENVRVRRAGYASRMPYDRFVTRYGVLSDTVYYNQASMRPEDAARQLLHDIAYREGTDFAIGYSKVFIRNASAVFQLEDLLDRKTNEAVQRIQKVWKTYKQAKRFLQVRYDCYELVNGKKERRRRSVQREYTGDYLDFAYNPLVKGVLDVNSAPEKILFADRARNVAIKGKKSLFKAIASAFSKTEDVTSGRFLMLTDAALYSFIFETEQDTGSMYAKMYFRIPLNMIVNATMSRLQDDFFILHFSPNAGTTDVLMSCAKKTEFVGLLRSAVDASSSRKLTVHFSDFDEIVVPRKNKFDKISIAFIRDESFLEEAIFASSKSIEIKVATGLSSHNVPVPFKPVEADPSRMVREQLRAEYDFVGNGIDELSFRTGDIISVIDPAHDGWYRGELEGNKGYVPSTYVTPLQKNANTGSAAKHKAVKQNMSNSIKNMWQAILDEESGEYYYFNVMTGASQWEVPPGI